jgi:hypothetical protein
MKINELRIGNYLYLCGWTVKVVGVREDGVYVTNDLNTIFKVDITEVRPISLTKGFFEKNGFVKERFYCKVFYFKKIKGMILKAYEHPVGWEIHMKHEESINAFSKGIDYVHELQNAYYVSTGEELEVKL